MENTFSPFSCSPLPFIHNIDAGNYYRILSPVGIMMGINLGTFLAGAFLIHRIIQTSGGSGELAGMGALLFGLWPFVGLTYTVEPLADMPSIFLFLTGLYLLLTSGRLSAAILFGLSMITHKVMWIFVGMLVFTELFYDKRHTLRQDILFITIIFFPIGILWLTGSFYHNSATWLFSSNLEVEISSRGSLPLLDGLIGTITQGGIKDLIKGIMLMGFACIAAVTVYASYKLKFENFQYGIVIALTIFLLFLILNQHEIWAAMRFGRLLVVPLMLMVNTKLALRNAAWWKSPLVIASLLMLFLSQFAYAWYMAVIYFG